MTPSAPLSSSSSSSSSLSTIPPSSSSQGTSSLISKTCICQNESLPEPTPQMVFRYQDLFPSYSFTVAMLKHIYRVEQLTIKRKSGNTRILPLRIINELIRKKHAIILVDRFPAFHFNELFFAPSLVVFTAPKEIAVEFMPDMWEEIGYAVCRLPQSSCASLPEYAHSRYVYSKICIAPYPSDSEPFCSISTLFDWMDEAGGRIGCSRAGNWLLELMCNNACYVPSPLFSSKEITLLLASSPFSCTIKSVPSVRKQTQISALEAAVENLPTRTTASHLCKPSTDNVFTMKTKIASLNILPDTILSMVISYLGSWTLPATYKPCGTVASS